MEAETKTLDVREVYNLLIPLPHLSLTTCLDMEQFVLVPALLLNKLNTTKSTLKVDLPKYQPQQTPTSQVN